MCEEYTVSDLLEASLSPKGRWRQPKQPRESLVPVVVLPCDSFRPEGVGHTTLVHREAQTPLPVQSIAHVAQLRGHSWWRMCEQGMRWQQLLLLVVELVASVAVVRVVDFVVVVAVEFVVVVEMQPSISTGEECAVVSHTRNQHGHLPPQCLSSSFGNCHWQQQQPQRCPWSHYTLHTTLTAHTTINGHHCMSLRWRELLAACQPAPVHSDMDSLHPLILQYSHTTTQEMLIDRLYPPQTEQNRRAANNLLQQIHREVERTETQYNSAMSFIKEMFRKTGNNNFCTLRHDLMLALFEAGFAVIRHTPMHSP